MPPADPAAPSAPGREGSALVHRSSNRRDGMAATQQRPTLLRRLAWLGAGSLLAVSALGSTAGSALAAGGTIWTTREDCADPNPQNENQYETGDHVSIRGSGFEA